MRGLILLEVLDLLFFIFVLLVGEQQRQGLVLFEVLGLLFLFSCCWSATNNGGATNNGNNGD